MPFPGTPFSLWPPAVFSDSARRTHFLSPVTPPIPKSLSAKPKRKNRAPASTVLQSITNCSFSISLAFILFKLPGAIAQLSLRNRRQLCTKPQALNPGVVALSSFPKAMRPDISLPDAPLNTCPAAFLTGQAALIAELHAQAGGARWGVPLGDFAGALSRGAVRHLTALLLKRRAGTYLRGCASPI